MLLAGTFWNCLIGFFGIYDHLCETERKLPESMQITIVDISCLVEE